MSFHPSLQNETSHPSPLTSLSGPGLPGGVVTNGPRGQSVSGLFQGVGVPGGGFDLMHTGPQTSTADQASNPRQTIHTQYFLDADHMDLNVDIGNMELCWADVTSGPVGVIGQNKPMVFKSLRAMNAMFRTAEAIAKWSDEDDVRWFNAQFSCVGVVRHEDGRGYTHSAGNQICQLFSTGFRVRMIDIWCAYEGKRGEQGPEIGDVCHIVLRKFVNHDELKRVQGESDTRKGYFWQLCPIYTKNSEDPPICAFKNHKDPEKIVCGESYRICKVAVIYGAPQNSGTARAIARKYVYGGHPDSSFKAELLKLRQVEVEILTT